MHSRGANGGRKGQRRGGKEREGQEEGVARAEEWLCSSWVAGRCVAAGAGHAGVFDEGEAEDTLKAWRIVV